MTNWATLQDRQKLLRKDHWDEEAWDTFYKTCNVRTKYRAPLNKLRELVNAKPISPKRCVTERAKFVKYKETEEYRNRVAAAWGLKRILPSSVSYRCLGTRHA